MINVVSTAGLQISVYMCRRVPEGKIIVGESPLATLVDKATYRLGPSARVVRDATIRCSFKKIF